MKQTPQDFREQGLQACDKKEYDQAIDLFTHALKLDPGDASSRCNRAKTYYQLKQNGNALADFDILIEKNPEKAHYYGERAIIRFIVGNKSGTLDDLDKAVSLEPEKPYRYASRAFLKDRMGDFDGALKDYGTAIRLDPEDAISHNNKGLVEEKMGNTREARQSFHRADSLDPNYTSETTSPRQTVHEAILPQNRSKTGKITLSGYFRQIKRLFSSAEERRGFLDFFRRKFGKQE